MDNDLQAIEDGGWKTHEVFKNFVLSMSELNEEEKKLQQEKMKYFLFYFRDSFQKHFAPWIEDSLFFFLYIL